MAESCSQSTCGSQPIEPGNNMAQLNAARFQNNPRYEITVGPAGPAGAGADIVGNSGRAIQIAIDALDRRGGGIVRLMPGEYFLDDAVRLRPNVSLIGDDQQKTILRRRGPLVWSRLKLDADASQNEITPENPERFRPGMGLMLWEERFRWTGCHQPLIITRIENGVLHLHDYIVQDRCAEHGGLVANEFPMILMVHADASSIEGLTLDAAVDDPENVVASHSGGVVRVWRSRNVTIRNITACNGRGDGIRCGHSSTGALIEDCHCYNNSNYGIHPGSHSKSCIVRRCDIHDNSSDGLYICWGICDSQFTDNRIYRNGLGQYRSGISIGHKDVDNLIARNHIYENKKYGVCFRTKTMGNAAHRVTLRDNVIENNGSRADEFAELKQQLQPWESIGVGVSVCGMTQDLLMENNTIRETRQGDDRLQRHAVYLHPGVSGVKMSGNKISGHPEAAIVDQSGGTNDLQTAED